MKRIQNILEKNGIYKTRYFTRNWTLFFDRYGSVQLDEEHNVTCFNEKKKMKEGLINGGVLILDRIIQEFSPKEVVKKFANIFVTNGEK